MIKELDVSGFVRDRLEMHIKDYEHMLERRHELDRMMAEAVLKNDAMLGLMQLPGFYLHASFVLQALVEDPRRFPTAAKLAAYAGLSPTPNRDGESMFKRKMIRFYSELGKARMRELGYPSRADFAKAMAKEFYGALPEASKESAA